MDLKKAFWEFLKGFKLFWVRPCLRREGDLSLFTSLHPQPEVSISHRSLRGAMEAQSS